MAKVQTAKEWLASNGYTSGGSGAEKSTPVTGRKLTAKEWFASKGLANSDLSNLRASKKVNDWIDSYNSAIGGFQKYRETLGDRWDADYAGEWYKKLQEVQKGYSGIKSYADQIGFDADGVFSDLKSLTGGIEDYRKYLSQWDSDDSYQSAKRNYEYSTRYGGKSYAEAKQLLSELPEGEERTWLENRQRALASSDDYLDTLKSDEIGQIQKDYDNAYTEKSARILQLQQLQVGYSRAGMAKELKEVKKELASAQEELQELKTRKQNLEWAKTRADRRETADAWKKNRSNDDFSSGAAAGAGISNPTTQELQQYDIDLEAAARSQNAAEITRLTENPVRVNNKLEFYLQNRDYGGDYRSNSAAQWEKLIQYGDTHNWGQLNQEEIELYNYILYSQGEEAADRYLEDMQIVIDKREYDDQKARTEEGYNKSGFSGKAAMNAATFPASVFGGAVSFADDVLNGLSGNGYNPYSPAKSITGFSKDVRDMSAEEIRNAAGGGFWGDLAANTYQGAMSAGDSLLRAATVHGVAPVKIGKVELSGSDYLMFMGAAADKAQELYESGASNKQMAIGAITAGSIETLFEHWSLEKYTEGFVEQKPENIAMFLKQVLAQSGVEGSEELFTELANMGADAILYGANADNAKLVQELKNKGLSDSEAKWAATMAAAEQAWWAFYGGAVSGGGMGFFGGGANAMMNSYYQNQYYNRQGRNILDSGNLGELVQSANALQDSTGKNRLMQLANELAGVDHDALGEMSDIQRSQLEKNAGRLYRGVTREQENAADNAKRTAFTRMAKDALEKQGTQNADRAARVITKAMYDGALSRSESRLFSQVGGKKIIDSILNKRGADNRSELEYAAQKESDRAEKSLIDTYRLAHGGNRGGTAAEAYTVSDDHRTTVKGQDGKTEAVRISGVESAGNGSLTLRLEDGRTVDAKDVSYASSGEAMVYAAVASMDIRAEDADSLISFANASGVGMERYALGIQEAYRYGKMGIPYDQIDGSGFAIDLKNEYRKNAYNLGAIAAIEARAKQKKRNEGRTVKANNTGKVILDGVSLKGRKLNEQQSAGMQLARFLAAAGMNVYVYESTKGADGRYRNRYGSANGTYMDKDGSIHIDLAAGNSGEGTMAFTISHEFTHFIEDWSGEKFRIFANSLFEELGKSKVDVDAMVAAKLEQAKGRTQYRGKTDEQLHDIAYSEVVAECCETMLTDTDALKHLSANIKTRDQTLWDKIAEFFRGLADRLKKAYQDAGLRPDSEIANQARDTIKNVEKLSKLWAEAGADAVTSFRAAANRKSEQTLAEAGIAVDGETESGSLFSVRYLLKDEEKEKAASALVDRFGVTRQEAMGWLNAETSIASLILNPKYSSYLDYEADPMKQAIKKNSDYPQGTVDFSNICKKRREFTQVMNRVLRNFPNHVFAATDLARIRSIMGEEGMTLPCGICYVEDRRQLDTIVAQDFLDALKLYRDGSDTRPDGKPFNQNQLKGLRMTEGDTYVPSIYELVSQEGRNRLKETHPKMEAAWVRYNNSRGMQSVRLLTNEAEYKRQILKYNRRTVQSKNNNGGLRIYSFSDAEMFHLIDIVQVITDSAAVGLKIQGYTKVNEYARAVKDTGEKLNRSLIPKGELGYHLEDGKVVLDYDTVEGIDIHHKDFFDNRDNPDVGNITIGVNDVQIRAAMVSDFVDQIIPFHTGQSKEVLGEKGIASWVNYKDYQTDKDIATGKTSKHQVNIYTEVIQAAEEEGTPIQNKRQFVERYLKVCRENGLQPRFSQFLNTDAQGNYIYTEGYHKLLVDFKTFAQTEVGEYLPQMPVKPIFDDAYITGILNDYVREQQTKDAEVAKQMPRVIQRITDEIIHGTGELNTDEKNTAGDGGEILYSVRDGRLSSESTDQERYDLLKDAFLKAAIVKTEAIKNVNLEDYNTRKKSAVIPGFRMLALQLGILNVDLNNSEILFPFQFSRKSLEKSIHHQLEYGGTYQDYVKCLSCFNELVKNAIPIEVHPEKKKGTIRENPDLKQTYVLVSAFQDEKTVVPVEMEVKTFWSANSKLYMTVALTKIDSEVLEKAPAIKNGDTPSLLPESMYSLQSIFKNVNPKDRRFLKYVPDGFLNDAQKQAKNEALQMERSEYASYGTVKLSDRDDGGMSNRELLANALEETVQTEVEAKRLAQYKEQIQKVSQEQQKLGQLKKQIQELTFGGGKKDAQKLKALKEEAIKTANRIGNIDRKLLTLESTQSLKNLLDRERKNAMQYVRKQNHEAVERRNKTEVRNMLKRTVKELNDYLLNESKTKHVPEEMKAAVAVLLDSVNMDSVSAARRIAELQKKMDKTRSPGRREALNRQILRLMSMGAKTEEKLKNLHDAYEKLYTEAIDTSAYDEFLSEKILEAAEIAGDTPIMDMTREQLESVNDIFRAVLHRIREANRTFADSKRARIADISEEVMRDFGARSRKQYASDSTKAIRQFFWNNEKPVYAFERIGSPALMRMYENLRKGEDVWAVDIEDARRFYLECYDSYHVKNWHMDTPYAFESASGMRFTLTLEQMMSLYAYSKRPQARDHIRKGGIVIDENTRVTTNGMLGVKRQVNVEDATTYNISDQTLDDIIGKLTEQQKGFVDRMQTYMSQTMGEKGNEVSMAMYGIRIFKEQNYFPLKSADQYMPKSKEQKESTAKIKNSGFTKATVKNASNPIVLSSFFDVWANHVNDMSMYHAFVLPMEDFYRVYNYRTKATEDGAMRSVQALMENACGKEAVTYVDQFLKDLNGGLRADPRESLTKAMMAKFKKASVFASASVVIQQPSAIGRAFAVIDPKFFVGEKLTEKKHKALWEECKRYAPIAIIKEMGYFDTNMGKSTADYLTAKEYKGAKEIAEGLLKDSGYRDEVLSIGPSLADEVTWTAIWEACKREAKVRYSLTGEAMLQKAGERFTEVITRTQVYDSVFSRSSNMRSKSGLMSMLTAFMAEPTTSINMLESAMRKWNSGARRSAVKTSTAVLTSVILNAILVSFVYAARDDDDDKNYLEKYLSAFTSEVMEGFNPLTYIPLVKDVWSLLQGYNVERADLSLLADIIDSMNSFAKLAMKDTSGMSDEQLKEHHRSIMDESWKLADGFFSMLGIPEKNIRRDINAVIKLCSESNWGKSSPRTVWEAVKETAMKNIPFVRLAPKDSKADRLYDAVMSGDAVSIDRAKGKYKDQESIDSAMRTSIRGRLADGELDEDAANEQLVQYGGMESDDAYWKVAQWQYETENDDDFEKYGAFWDAVKSGKNLKAVIREYTDNGVSEATLSSQITSHFRPEYVKMSASERANIKGYLLNAMTETGKTREEAEKTMKYWDFEANNGFDYNEKLEMYCAGKITRVQLKAALMEMDDMYSAEADREIVAYDYIKAHPNTQLSITTAKSYTRSIENCDYTIQSSGLSEEQFLSFREKKALCNGTDSDGDGTRDSGSVQAQVVPIIDAMPISNAQKDTLWYFCGWSKKTLRNAPWHRR